MASDPLVIRIGRVMLRNPLVCGSGEHLVHEAGIRRALAAGAGAVVIKSANETDAAREQLAHSDYALLDSTWRRLEWRGPHPPDASLLCRSGLAPQPLEAWLELARRMDRLAADQDAYVIASIVPADIGRAVALAREVETAGVRVLELNVGAPHGEEALAGAIRLERSAARVQEITARVRAAVSLPLWVKLTGQSEDVAALVQAARAGGADAVTLMGRFMALVPDVETMAPLLGTRAAFGGPWALPLTCHWLAASRRRAGPDFPLIGTNGARSGLDIVRMLLAGARAVQMTSVVLVGGFGVVEQALLELREYLDARQITAEALVGRAADRIESYQAQPRRPGHWRGFVPDGSLD